MKQSVGNGNASIKKKQTIERLFALFSVAAFYGALQLAGITCPIKYLTGISCAGCGMTRAWIALLHLDFQKAFYFHPLFWAPPIVILVLLNKYKISMKSYKKIIFTVIVLFAIIYVFRLVSRDNKIVVFQPEDGVLFKILKKIT